MFSLHHRIIAEVCDECGGRFFYWLKVAPFAPPSFEVSEDTHRMLREQQEKTLLAKNEVVPCPQCGHINWKMLASRRGERKISVLAAWSIAIAIGGLLGTYGLHSAWSAEPIAAAPGTLVLMVFFLFAPAWMKLLAWLWKDHRNSDSKATNLKVPLGSPPALIEKSNPATGKRGLGVALDFRDDMAKVGDHVLVELERVRFPKSCCLCMAPATTVYLPFAQLSAVDRYISVPLCRSCSFHVHGQWWIYFAATAAVIYFVVNWMAFQFAWHIPLEWIWTEKSTWVFHYKSWLAIGAGLVAWIGFPLLIAERVGDGMCRPYFRLLVHADRDIYLFSTKNPQFNRLVLKEAERLYREIFYEFDDPPQPSNANDEEKWTATSVRSDRLDPAKDPAPDLPDWLIDIGKK